MINNNNLKVRYQGVSVPYHSHTIMDTRSVSRTNVGEGQVLSEQERPEGVGTRRMARFPAGTKLQPLSLVTRVKSHDNAKTVRADVARIPRPPFSINPPTATPSKPPPIQYDSPWDIYKPIRLLNRGGMVTSACTHSGPAKLVTIKRLSSGFTKELAVRHHENLLTVLELYKFDGALFVVTDYTTAPLRQLLPSAGELQEACVSSVCRQESQPPLPRRRTHPPTRTSYRLTSCRFSTECNT